MAKAPPSPLRSFFVLLVFGVFLLTLALVVRSHLLMRKNPGRPMNEAMRASLDGAPAERQLSAADERVVAEQFPGARQNKSGLRWIVRAPGTGEPPRAGQTARVRYLGRRLDGRAFDDLRASGEPLRLPVETALPSDGAPPRLTVGGGGYGAGWDEALAAMRPGERRTLIVPWWLGPFGAEGRAPTVPPHATLIYEVELVGVE
jgi:FKBP-type peptidyl-prolyl cis-trans isomerase